MAAAGGKHAARMAYRLAPTLTLVLELEVAPDATRECPRRGVTLRPGEVILDGEDEIGVVAFVHREDVEDPHQPVPGVTVERWKVELEGTVAEHLKWTRDEDFAEPDKTRFVVTSKAPRLARPGAAGLTLKASLRCRLPGPAGPGERLELSAELVLTPRPIFLKLWVVPGGVPGTSEAGVFACLAGDAARPLRGLPVAVKVDGGGSGSLAADSDEATTGADGIAALVLRWSGLTWAGLPTASFRVACGVVGADGVPTEATEVAIDVGRNLTDLLAAIHGDRKRTELDLDNPMLSLEGAGMIRSTLDYAFPDYLSGPALNIAYAVAATAGYLSSHADRASRYLGHYLCGSLASRLGGYMVRRRFGTADSDPERLQAMNGIEVNEYFLWYVPKSHHFAGIHLSGSGSDDDPRFIDPWWRQDWSLGDYLTANGLFDKNSERIRGTSSIALAALLTILAAKLLVFVFGIGMLTAAQMVRTFLASALSLGAPSLVVSTYTDACYVVDGSYQGYRQRWRTHAMNRLRQTSADPGAVSPVRAW